LARQRTGHILKVTLVRRARIARQLGRRRQTAERIVKRHPSLTRALAFVALVITLGGAAAVWPASRVTAIGNPDLRPVEFGLLGLAAGQTARLTVVNPALQAPPDPDSRARTVRLTFDIYAVGDVEHQPGPTTPGDSTARLTTLRVIARHSRVVSLRPGQAASLAFTATAADTYFSAVALGGPDTSPAIGNPDIAPTLEVMENNQTVYTHPALVKGFNPQPDPPGAR
jgi:hypothetical protein